MGPTPVGVCLANFVWLATAEPLGRAPTDSASVPDQAAALELAQRSAEEMFRADRATWDVGTVVEEVGPGRAWPAVDKRFNRSRYNAEVAVSAFAVRVGEQVDPGGHQRRSPGCWRANGPTESRQLVAAEHLTTHLRKTAGLS